MRFLFALILRRGTIPPPPTVRVSEAQVAITRDTTLTLHMSY